MKERSASQEHFLDLCRLLDEPTPAEADPTGETYCFERGARKDTGGDGWADVWKRHHFAWEYKGQRADLDAAFGQLRQYALALENPPLLIVSDMVRFRIRTNWTNSVSQTHEFALDDLADAATRDRLKWAFSSPERLRPGETRQSLRSAGPTCRTGRPRIRAAEVDRVTSQNSTARAASPQNCDTVWKRDGRIERPWGTRNARAADQPAGTRGSTLDRYIHGVEKRCDGRLDS